MRHQPKRSSSPGYLIITNRGLGSDTASHIITLFGWAPAISKMTFTGFHAQIIYINVNRGCEDKDWPVAEHFLANGSFVKTMGSVFFFAYCDRLYKIGRGLSVIEIDDYAAMGSGEDQTIGSLL